MKQHILIVDDERIITKALARIFQHHGFIVDTAHDGKEALKKVHKNNYDCVLLDIILPEMNGVDVLEKIKEKKPETHVIMMTAYSNAEALEKARELGSEEAILKPFDNIENVVKMTKALLGTTTYAKSKAP